MGHSTDNKATLNDARLNNNQKIVIGNSFQDESQSSPRLKSIGFNDGVPPIVEPSDKDEFTRRKSVVNKDFTGPGECKV